MGKVFGIDVSTWQRGFNFKEAKNEGVKFCILRGAYSLSKDNQFESHYKESKNLGLSVGVYHYSMATNAKEATAEAEFLYQNVLKGKQFELPIYFDVEDNVQKSLSRNQVTEIAKAWLSYLEERGYWVGIYSFKSFLETYITEDIRERYSIWVAQWSTECNYKGNYGMWQFGGETNLIKSNIIAGVVCDQNYMLEDYPSLIKNKGKNGYSKLTEIKEDSKVKTIKNKNYVVKSGDTLSFIALKNNTTVESICKINNIVDKNKIYVGQELKLVSDTKEEYYIVKSGDTLSGIALKYNISYLDIANINNIKNPYTIYPNQKLRIE